ncbi:MAG: hypothetical protein P4L46_16095 [Fimbriimonas sp.]|nr:hypothetical protein [Fimbriimonas sp.]
MGRNLWINGLIVAGAIGVGIAVTMRPWTVYMKQKADSEKSIARMNVAEAHGIKLLEVEDRAQSSIGREEAARKAGYIGPNELPADSAKK